MICVTTVSTYNTKSFGNISFRYGDVDIDLSSREASEGKTCVEIKLASKKDLDSILETFYQMRDLLFLITGKFPKVDALSWNGQGTESRKLSNPFLYKFYTGNHYSKPYFQFLEISENSVNPSSLENMKEINSKSIRSLQSVVSKIYDDINSTHRLLLLSHAAEGFVAHSKAHENDLKLIARQRDKPKNKVLYRDRINVLCAPFLEYHDKFDCGIFKLLGTRKKKFLAMITDTRHSYSHLHARRPSGLKDEDGVAFVYHTYLLYIAIRIFLLKDLIGLEPEENRMRECLYTIRDWIEANESPTEY